jgi:Uma2 family endonuclease
MSGLSKQYETMSLDDFEELLLDKPADEKWELIGGRVIRGMVGARLDHNRIVGNIFSCLMIGLRSKGSLCRPFAETFWLKQRFLDLAVFPDVMVRCGPLPPDATSLEDPVVIFEVLSKGSVQRDRIEKWALYQRLPSLQHYVLVEKDQIAVDVFDRTEGGFLQRPRLSSANDVLNLAAIDIALPLREIYRDVHAS